MILETQKIINPLGHKTILWPKDDFVSCVGKMKSYVGIFKLLSSKKQNKEFSEFVKTCDELVIGQHNSRFRVAGTKDKRSISTQKVCISHVTAEKLCRAVKTIRFWNGGQRVSIGNFSYEKDDLDLGDLKGNKFTIVLRNVEESKETIEKSLSGLKVS